MGAARVLAAPVFACALLVAFAGGVASAPVAHAQGRTIQVYNPDAQRRQLDDATARVLKNPSDMDALRDGAEAAARLGEFEQALGFLNRAEVLAPSDPQIRAARASILVNLGKPRLALPLFEEAERMGGDPEDFAIDRGLAHDLLGDQPSAQYFYAIANRIDPSDEVTRRYAFSLAVAGEREAAEAMLKPLLLADDPAAWRMKAFMLAVAGRPSEAVAMLYAVLPRGLAGNLAPYIRMVPRLTPGQQIAAAHLGIFPAEGGEDPSSGLVPGGAPFGTASAGQ